MEWRLNWATSGWNTECFVIQSEHVVVSKAMFVSRNQRPRHCKTSIFSLMWTLVQHIMTCAFTPNLQGLWIGLLSGVIVQTLILSYIIWKTDWDEQVCRKVCNQNLKYYISYQLHLYVVPTLLLVQSPFLQVNKASERLRRWFLNPDKDSTDSSSTLA